MDVFFANRRFAEKCASRKSLQRWLGTERAKRLEVRLQQLRQAEDLAAMRQVTARIHALTADRAGLVALDLVGPYRLLIEPIPPEDLDTWTWADVQQVLVHEVVDYH